MYVFLYINDSNSVKKISIEIMASTLYSLTAQKVVECFSKPVPVSFMNQHLPQSIEIDLVQMYGLQKMKQLCCVVDNCEDGFEEYLTNVKHDLEEYRWGRRIHDENLLKFLLWENEWQEYYHQHRIGLQFYYHQNIQGGLRVCRMCFLKHNNKQSPVYNFTCTVQQRMICSSKHLCNYVRDNLSWCGMCVNTPLFTVTLQVIDLEFDSGIESEED